MSLLSRKSVLNMLITHHQNLLFWTKNGVSKVISERTVLSCRFRPPSVPENIRNLFVLLLKGHLWGNIGLEFEFSAKFFMKRRISRYKMLKFHYRDTILSGYYRMPKIPYQPWLLDWVTHRCYNCHHIFNTSFLDSFNIQELTMLSFKTFFIE